MAIALVLFSITTAAFCDYFEPCEKTYVTENQTTVTRHGIFVKLDEKWFQTETLFSDVNGLFIRNLTPSGYGCPDPYNACRNCGRCIHREFNICPYCGRPA